MMRHTNVWEQLWEQLRESTEGPTVTLQVPRDVADQLLAMLATSLEVDDGGDMGDMDSDDFGGPPDGDEDDGFGMPPMGGDEGGDDDFFPGLGDEPDEDSDDEDDDDEPSPPKRKGKGSDDDDSDDEDDDDEEDEDTDEAADYGHSGGDPSGLRPQTALGESHIGFGKLKGQLSRKSGVRNPGALAASIGRKKYGARGMAARSAAGRK